MEFGTREEKSQAEAFREGLNLASAADDWGLDSVWLAEFHFSPDRSVLSSPIVVAGMLAGCTERIRIGLAVYVLPLGNPLRIAEEAATVDQLSGGRLDLGIGRSGFVGSYNSYNIDYGESQIRFDEAIQILRKGWSGRKFSFDGRFYKVSDALVVPQPVQRPYPPMRMAATSPQTFKTAAELGLPLFVGLRGNGLADLIANIRIYRTNWQKSGHAGNGNVFLRVPFYAAKTAEAAFEEPRENIIYYFERQARLVKDGSPKDGNAVQTDIAAKLSTLSYQNILKDRVAFGTAAALIDKVKEWRDVLGIDGIAAEMNAGGLLSEEQVKNSLRIIAEDVMPAFK